MKLELLDLLRCPQSGQRLEVVENTQKDIVSGWLVSEDEEYRYPIRDGIPRFVTQDNYADNFGFQWNHFRQTQLDSYTGHPISADRFWKATGWLPSDMKDKWVLDIGCGAGRFSEVVLNAGAKVVAMDYSNAIDACYANLRHHPNLHVVQGDIYALPFIHNFFPFTYSLGVLQHTPDVAKAFAALPPMLHSGGKLCVDYYEKTWKSLLLPKYRLRPITKRLNKARLFSFLQNTVPALLIVSRVLGRIPFAGKMLKRMVPVANYYGVLPLTDQQQRDWALLDTFDNLSPAYDNPQSSSAVKLWMEQAGLDEIEVLKAGHLVARGTKKK